MADVLLIGVLVLFALACIAYIRWCDSIVRADLVESPPAPADPIPSEVTS